MSILFFFHPFSLCVHHENTTNVHAQYKNKKVTTSSNNTEHLDIRKDALNITTSRTVVRLRYDCIFINCFGGTIWCMVKCNGVFCHCILNKKYQMVTCYANTKQVKYIYIAAFLYVLARTTVRFVLFDIDFLIFQHIYTTKTR